MYKSLGFDCCRIVKQMTQSKYSVICIQLKKTTRICISILQVSLLCIQIGTCIKQINKERQIDHDVSDIGAEAPYFQNAINCLTLTTLN